MASISIYKSRFTISILRSAAFLLAVTHAQGQATKTTKMTVFEDIKTGAKLVDSVIQSNRTETANDCALLCNKHPDCLSFNFCNYITCQLNSEDKLTSGRFQSDPGCKYMGMRIDFLPLCEEKGKEVNVSVVNAHSNCKFYKKRVSSDWGPWGPTITTVDSAYEWIQVQRRQPLVEGVGGEKERIVTWLQWGRYKESWEAARDNCKERGGSLFSNVDGSEEQLHFLMGKLNYHSLWIGINTEDHQIWVAVNGTAITAENLHWNAGEPDNEDGNEYCMAIEGKASVKPVGLSDMNCPRCKRFICDMI